MKNQFLLSVFILTFFFASPVKSQITISPEIGISYLPFKLYPQSGGSFRNINSKKPNLLLGVSAQMPIFKKWSTKLRISYTNRNNVEWVEFGDFGQGSADYEWKHQDLNIDLNVYYKLSKRLSIGVGPSSIRSFMDFKKTPHDEDSIRHWKVNRFFFGLNSTISLEVKKININLMYLRTRRYNGTSPFRLPNGDNRIDFTIGYRIGKGK